MKSVSTLSVLMLFSILLFPIAGNAGDADAARAEMIQKGIKICERKGFKTLGEKDSCISEFTKRANEKYPVRGTDSYSRKNYSGLSKAQAEAMLITLKKEWENAPRAGYFSARKSSAAVSRKAISEEGWWIQENVLGTRRSQDDPWFIECKGFQTANIVRRCELGKGGGK